MTRQFTGYHMAAVLVAFFGTVVAVNLTMARLASSTFGGVVVQNTYVASQKYNGWLEQAKAQRALGWDAATTRQPDGRLLVTVSGAPSGAAISALARHPLGRLPDQPIAFEPAGPGRYFSAAALPAGRWTLRLEIAADGRTWRREEELP